MIAANTFILLVRVVVTMAVTIFGTRFAIQALGNVTYGVYAATAGLPLMLALLTGAMGAATQRMLAASLGKEPIEGRRTFSASLGPHLAVALLIVFAGETLGMWLLQHAIQMPGELRESAPAALRIAVAATALGALLAPYEALLQVRERFALFVVLDVGRSLTVLLGSWFLIDYSGDRLVGYAVVQSVAAVGAMVLGCLIVMWQYPEGRLRPSQMFSRSDLGQRWPLFSWTIFGSLASVARIQGFVILANVLFGPSASAALSVGNQLVGVIRQLSTTVGQAVAPRIYKLEANGDRGRMVATALIACKYSGLIGAILAAPLMIELSTVLGLWLGTPPPGASAVVALLTIASLLDQLSLPISYAHLAIGRIALYQLVCGIVTIAALPIGFMAAKLGGDLSVILAALVATSGVVSVLRVVLLAPHSPGVFRSWLRITIVPVAIGFGTGVLAGLVATSTLEPSFVRVIATTTASSIALLGVTYLGLAIGERLALGRLTKRLLWCVKS